MLLPKEDTSVANKTSQKRKLEKPSLAPDNKKAKTSEDVPVLVKNSVNQVSNTDQEKNLARSNSADIAPIEKENPEPWVVATSPELMVNSPSPATPDQANVHY